MMRVILRVGIALMLLGTGYFVYLLFAGDSWTIDPPWYSSNPRMYVQPHVRTYQEFMPHPPAGAVPRQDARGPLPTSRQATTLTVAPATARDLAAGGVYYEYYCLACHGPIGDGNGPVGESYVPRPADLRSRRVAGYSDGQLLRAMLLGVGHEPVLEYTVLPEHRWPLVHYVRQLRATND